MGINIKSLSGLYTGTKNLFKVGETTLPKYIDVPSGAVNIELFNINKAGNPFKDMYVFKDKELLEYYLFEKLFDGEALFTKVNNSTININDKFYKEASLESHDDKVDKVEAYVGEELISYNVIPY